MMRRGRGRGLTIGPHGPINQLLNSARAKSNSHPVVRNGIEWRTVELRRVELLPDEESGIVRLYRGQSRRRLLPYIPRSLELNRFCRRR